MPLPVPLAKVTPVRFNREGTACTGIPQGSGIYRITCVPMRLAYVGQAFSLVKRCLEHQQALLKGVHTNPRLQGAYKRFGPLAFRFEVLEFFTGRYKPDILSPLEQRWMDAHGKASLFNVRPAGSDAWIRRQNHAGSNNDSGDNRPLGRVQAPGTQSAKDWRNNLRPKKK